MLSQGPLSVIGGGLEPSAATKGVFSWVKTSAAGAVASLRRRFSSSARTRLQQSQSQSTSAAADQLVSQRANELVRGGLAVPRHRSSLRWSSVLSAATFFENKHGFRKEELLAVRLLHTSNSQRFFVRHPVAQPASTGSFLSLRRQFSRLSSVSRHLEEQANRYPNNALVQALYLKEAGKIDPQYVIDRFESGRYAANQDCRREYLQALSNLGYLDKLRTETSEGDDLHLHLGKSNGFRILSLPDTIPVSIKKSKWDVTTTLMNIVVSIVILCGAVLLFFDGGRLSGKLSNNTVKAVMPDEAAEKCSFDDVAGVEEAKDELLEVVEFLRSPEKFQRVGAKIPKGVLVTGNPGTGKTLIARAVAGEAGVPFYYTSGSEFEEVWVGVGASRIRNLFETAQKNAPCIIFIDELDTIGSQRINDARHPYARQTINQLLVEMDGFNEMSGIVLIGATNFPETLDKALVRPGRFDSHIHIPMPDVRGRFEILKVHSRKVPLHEDVDLSIVARGTPGFSGADLKNLINQAAIKATFDNDDEIHMKQLDFAREKILMGSEHKSRKLTRKQLLDTAYHEAGHAICAIKTPGTDPVYKATIVPRGQALGMVVQLPEDDQLSHTRQDLERRMTILMGGYAAEELVFGKDHVTGGCSNDLEKSTHFARLMVTKLGMSEKIGRVTITGKDYSRLSPQMKELVDEEVRRISEEAYERAKSILTKYKKEHTTLAEALLKYETLSGDEIRQLLDGKELDRKI